jgi:hypothetical protein
VEFALLAGNSVAAHETGSIGPWITTKLRHCHYSNREQGSAERSDIDGACGAG